MSHVPKTVHSIATPCIMKQNSFMLAMIQDMAISMLLEFMNFRGNLFFSPKFDTLSYIIFIASVCSLWLGFVVFDSVLLLIPPIVKQYSKRNVSPINHHKTLNTIANFHLSLIMQTNNQQTNAKQ